MCLVQSADCRRPGERIKQRQTFRSGAERGDRNGCEIRSQMMWNKSFLHEKCFTALRMPSFQLFFFQLDMFFRCAGDRRRFNLRCKAFNIFFTAWYLQLTTSTSYKCIKYPQVKFNLLSFASKALLEKSDDWQKFLSWLLKNFSPFSREDGKTFKFNTKPRA